MQTVQIMSYCYCFTKIPNWFIGFCLKLFSRDMKVLHGYLSTVEVKKVMQLAFEYFYQVSFSTPFYNYHFSSQEHQDL